MSRWRRGRPRVSRGIRIQPTGVVIDHYPPVGAGAGPVVWIRTPYGRRGMASIARGFASAGTHVVVEDVDGSSLVRPTAKDADEVAAVGAVVVWLRQQPWFAGVIATWGISAIGYTSWRLAAHRIPEWKLAILQDAQSELRDTVIFPGGAFAGSVALGSFVHSVEWLARHPRAGMLRSMVASVLGARRAKKVLAEAPLGTADQRLVGHSVDYFQQWIAHEHDDEFWAQLNLRSNAAGMPEHVHLASGWYDVCLVSAIADYRALRAAGKQVRLLIGPWYHGRGAADRAYKAEIAALVRAVPDLPTSADDPARVRVHVSGIDQWRDLPDWPPPHVGVNWYLHPDRQLEREAVKSADALATYRYDPADPTPSVGGAVENLDGNAGAKDNRPLEARADVLTFTSPVLTEQFEAIGPATAHIRLRADIGSLDVFVRVCDVYPDGRSVNICDGIRRIRAAERPADPNGVRTVDVDLVASAHVFQAGHRIRVQVSSGAHPRFVRNLGSDEPLATATTMRGVSVEIHPGSSIRLPNC